MCVYGQRIIKSSLQQQQPRIYFDMLSNGAAAAAGFEPKPVYAQCAIVLPLFSLEMQKPKGAAHQGFYSRVRRSNRRTENVRGGGGGGGRDEKEEQGGQM
jgi:hypothetical protein